MDWPLTTVLPAVVIVTSIFAPLGGTLENVKVAPDKEYASRS